MVSATELAMGAAVVGVLATLVYVGAIGYGVSYLRERRARGASADATYDRLVAETVETQRALVEETRRLNAALDDVERLLKEV